MLLRKLSSYTVEKTVEKIRVKKRVKIVEVRVMLKLVLILALVVAALSAPLGEVPRRPNPLAIHRTRGFYQGLLEFWTSGQEKEFWSRMSLKRIRVTQAVEQDKADESDESDKKISSIYTDSQKELLRGTFNRRRSSAAFQKTRRYYEGLSPQQKEEFWSRVRSGNKADEESYKHQMSIG